MLLLRHHRIIMTVLFDSRRWLTREREFGREVLRNTQVAPKTYPLKQAGKLLMVFNTKHHDDGNQFYRYDENLQSPHSIGRILERQQECESDYRQSAVLRSICQ